MIGRYIRDFIIPDIGIWIVKKPKKVVTGKVQWKASFYIHFHQNVRSDHEIPFKILDLSSHIDSSQDFSRPVEFHREIFTYAPV